MRIYKCPHCGDIGTYEDNTYVVQCACGQLKVEVDGEAESKKDSPTVIFKGKWNDKEEKNG